MHLLLKREIPISSSLRNKPATSPPSPLFCSIAGSVFVRQSVNLSGTVFVFYCLFSYKTYVHVHCLTSFVLQFLIKQPLSFLICLFFLESHLF